MHQDIHDADQVRDLIRPHESRENESVLHAQLAHPFFKASAPFAVADEKELDSRATPQQRGSDGEQIVVALELEQSRNLADHDVVGFESPLGSEWSALKLRCGRN